MLNNISPYSTLLLSFAFLKSASLMKYASSLFKLYGNRCLDVISGCPTAVCAGESCVPSRTSTILSMETKSQFEGYLPNSKSSYDTPS